MRKFIAIVNSFISDRTHLWHFLGGVGIFLVVLLASAIGDSKDWGCGLSATVAVFATMFSLEIKDKQYGNKVDWADILAGMVFPIVFWVALTISYIVSWLGIL